MRRDRLIQRAHHQLGLDLLHKRQTGSLSTIRIKRNREIRNRLINKTWTIPGDQLDCGDTTFQQQNCSGSTNK